MTLSPATGYCHTLVKLYAKGVITYVSIHVASSLLSFTIDISGHLSDDVMINTEVGKLNMPSTYLDKAKNTSPTFVLKQGISFREGRDQSKLLSTFIMNNMRYVAVIHMTELGRAGFTV